MRTVRRAARGAGRARRRRRRCESKSKCMYVIGRASALERAPRLAPPPRSPARRSRRRRRGRRDRGGLRGRKRPETETGEAPRGGSFQGFHKARRETTCKARPPITGSSSGVSTSGRPILFLIHQWPSTEEPAPLFRCASAPHGQQNEMRWVPRVDAVLSLTSCSGGGGRVSPPSPGPGGRALRTRPVHAGDLVLFCGHPAGCCAQEWRSPRRFGRRSLSPS